MGARAILGRPFPDGSTIVPLENKVPQTEENRMREFLAAALCASIAVPALALAEEAKVDFSMNASMPSLRDASKHDTFKVGITDAKIATNLKIECQAGQTKAFVLRTDEACSVSGTGSIINPSNPSQKLPRTQYAGGYTVKADGLTEGRNLTVNYLAVGKVPASAESFGGTMTLKPENPSGGASALKEALLKKLNGEKAEGTLIDERVDSVELSGFVIPSAGLPSEKGCTWTGDMIFSYQTESWFINVTATCGDKTYALKGNMPWTDTPGVSNQTQYDLTLTLPNAAVSSDDALFASAEGDSDLFASVDGITGTILMKESGHVKTMVDGVEDEIASQVDATGTLTGKNVSLEAVRSLTTLIGILSRTFFGA